MNVMNKKYERYIEYIVNDIEPPYLKSLEPYGLKQEEIDLVLGIVFNQPVTIKGNWVYNTDDNRIYGEDSDGYWYKNEFDQYGNNIYYENSDGYWYKEEFDQYGNRVYYEDSDGNIIDNRR